MSDPANDSRPSALYGLWLWVPPAFAVVAAGTVFAAGLWRRFQHGTEPDGITVVLLLAICAMLWRSHAMKTATGVIGPPASRVQAVLLAIATVFTVAFGVLYLLAQ